MSKVLLVLNLIEKCSPQEEQSFFLLEQCLNMYVHTLYGRVGWCDLAFFAIFEKRHISADLVQFKKSAKVFIFKKYRDKTKKQ